MTGFGPHTENHGHVLECGGVPPLLGKPRVSFRPRLRRRSKSGGTPAFAERPLLKVRVCDGLWRGRPPHSKTQAKLGAANDLLCNWLKISPHSSGHLGTKNNAYRRCKTRVFKIFGMTRLFFTAQLSNHCPCSR